MPNSKDRLFVLVEVDDDNVSLGAVHTLIEGIGGKVVDSVSAEPEVLVSEGMPTIAWIDNLYSVG